MDGQAVKDRLARSVRLMRERGGIPAEAKWAEVRKALEFVLTDLGELEAECCALPDGRAFRQEVKRISEAVDRLHDEALLRSYDVPKVVS